MKSLSRQITHVIDYDKAKTRRYGFYKKSLYQLLASLAVVIKIVNQFNHQPQKSAELLYFEFAVISISACQNLQLVQTTKYKG